MKYVVLARSKADDMIVDSFGVYSRKRFADRRLEQIDKSDADLYYEVEEVDQGGSFANDRVIE